MAHPKGGYKIEGKRVPGVTTIIGRFKDSGALLHWAYKQGEDPEIESLYQKRDEAGDAGTLAHSLVEAHIKGESISDVLEESKLNKNLKALASNAFDSYLKWEGMTKLNIIEQELSLVAQVPICSPSARVETFGFGGTFDAIGEIDGQLCLVDWKTSNYVFDDYLLQLAAYDILIHECTDYELTGGFHLCRFSKEHGDFAHYYWNELDQAKEQFLALVACYDRAKALKKRCG
jgi:hypothetical protein